MQFKRHTNLSSPAFVPAHYFVMATELSAQMEGHARRFNPV